MWLNEDTGRDCAFIACHIKTAVENRYRRSARRREAAVSFAITAAWFSE
ncbi:MAG TPA: hypothetical protein VFV34_29360 [Blastocatellia bacterium]|nr:hypothetical protein [Blastocatellia bacterium]